MLQIEYIPIKDLKPYKRNARKHQEKDVNVVAESIKRFGFDDPIGIWGNDNTIVEGHGRLMAAQQLGMDEVPCIRLDHLTDDERRAYALVHNKSAELSEWDDELLELELDELDELEDIDMEDFRFELSDGGVDQSEVSEDDYEADVPKEPRAKVGDVYRLGNHRLICGDSTDVNVIDRLMDGVKADMVFTDSPYGVSYTDKNEFLNSIDNADRLVNAIENDSKTPEEMYEFWKKAFTVLANHSADKMSYYITAPQGGDLLLLLLLLQAVRDSGFALKHVLVWNKNNHVLGRCDYNYKHEPIVYGWKQKGTHEFYGAGEMKTSVWDIPKPLRNDLHPTMKPIELIANALLNSTKKGDAVIDTFGGSGSTLIACEQLNRKCYMAELSPGYVDVIIDRWEKFTGKKAVLLNS